TSRSVLVFINTATYAPSAAAPCSEDARSRSDAMPARIVEEERQSRRGPDRGPRPARDCDRAPAPPAPPGPRHSACGADRGQAEGLAGLCESLTGFAVASKGIQLAAFACEPPPAYVIVIANRATQRRARTAKAGAAAASAPPSARSV